VFVEVYCVGLRTRNFATKSKGQSFGIIEKCIFAMKIVPKSIFLAREDNFPLWFGVTMLYM
jgi:hypothetical protein